MEPTLLIGAMFDELSKDMSISSEDRVRIQFFSDALKTPYQDQILTVLIPLLWYLRERVWAVSPRVKGPSAEVNLSEAAIRKAVAFFDSDEFIEKCYGRMMEICDSARSESLAEQRRGMAQQKNGLALFLVSNDTLEREVYPDVQSLLCIIRRKAHSYHPSRDRSVLRLCQRLSDIISSISLATL